MLSTCWLTTPFSGCFNTAIKGGVGLHDSGEGGPLGCMTQQPPPPATEKNLSNGIAGKGGLPPAGLSSERTRGGVVTTIAPKSQNQILPSSDYRQEKAHVRPLQEQPQTPPLEKEQLGMEEDDKFFKRTYKSEYRKKFRPFSQYQYVDGKFSKSKAEKEPVAGNTWYKEVLELRKQAGQYRARQDLGDVWQTVQCRGWGVETASDRMAEIYNKQVELWEQVSRRSSLQALSLASAAPSRPISKAEKELENSRRSSPIKHTGRDRPHTAPSKHKPAPVHVSNKLAEKIEKGEKIAEKIEKPEKVDKVADKVADKVDGKSSKETTPRHHYDRTTGGDAAAKRRPPRAISIARTTTPKEAVKETKTPKSTSAGRSVSAGPENRSPKRTSRPPSTHTQTPAAKPERRPRPSDEDSKKDHKEKEKDTKDIFRESLRDGRKATPEPRFDPEKYEPVVKTPPEPTRVKSPDQVMVKSPDPVNWTVPLDTGKTFTVTHNIPEGESSRGTPSSEHRPPLEPRSRQTPEPTRIYQGSLAGTPITTAGTTPSAITATASSTVPQEKITTSMTDSGSTSKAPSSIGTTATSSIPSQSTAATATATSAAEEKPKDPVSGVTSKVLEASEPKIEKEGKDSSSTEPKMNSSIYGHLDSSKPISSEVEPKETPVQSSKPYQEVPKASESEATSGQLSSSASVSPNPPLGFSSGADPMTMSVFGSINGMNGKGSGTPSPTKPEVPLPESSKKDPESLGPRTVPGTNMKCLDDPSFLYEKSPVVSGSQKSPGYKVLDAPITEPIQPTKPVNYRVLEAPPADIKDLPDHSPTQPMEAPTKPSPYRVLEAPMEPPTRPKGSPYRVLEAPDAPLSQQPQPVVAGHESIPPSLVSPSSGRTVTEALDKARTRFDSFWGGGKDKDPPSKV